jgi:ABC-type transport system involved in cytochrome c biogenesis permease subunit
LNVSPGSLEGRIYLGLERIFAGLTDGIVFESDYARRTFAERIGSLALPWLFAVTARLLLPGLWLALVVSPPDYQQGDTVRIMYVHVPAAWMSLFVYTSMAVSAAVGLVWKHPLAEVYAKAAAPVGAGFTALCLATGSLWGEPMWGTWWQWDARMTSVLVLFFLLCLPHRTDFCSCYCHVAVGGRPRTLIEASP